MKIDLEKIDQTDFNVRPFEWAGEEHVWVYPKLEGVSWKKENLHLRSSIWRKSDGELISAGFKKFCNWNEKSEVYPTPTDINPKMKFVEKVDGSCLIVSKYKGELITRTRRAPTYLLPKNGHEIELLKKKYPLAFDNLLLNSEENSFIFEWISPENQIVLRYPEPDLRLIGVIHHKNYTLTQQAELDKLGEIIGVPRPKYYQFNDVEEMLTSITDWKGTEGICVYFANEQLIRKVKSNWYNVIHAFRGEMSLKNIVDLYLEYLMPDYNLFYEILLEQFGYEGVELAKPLISSICDAKRESEKIVLGMKRFLNLNCDGLPTRLAKIEKINSAYGKTSRGSIAITLLDKNEPELDQWKKLLFQTLIAK